MFRVPRHSWLLTVGGAAIRCVKYTVAFFAISASAQNGSQSIYLQSLTNFETYGESIWHTASYANAPADSGYWGDGATTGHGGIRGSDGVALAYAVMIMAQPGSPSNTTRLAHLRQALNYAALTHAGTGTNV